MAWTVDLGAFGLTPHTGRMGSELNKALNNLTTTKVSKKRREQIKKAASAKTRVMSKENTVKEVVSRGTWKSSITGKEYSSYAKAYAAGEASKRMTGRVELLNAEEEYIYKHQKELTEKSLEIAELRKEIRQYYKEHDQKVNLKGKKRAEIREEAERIRRIREIEASNERMEQALEEMESWEDIDEDEWEEVQNRPEEKPQVTDDIYCYWDDVKHGLIGNPYYYLHTSGSWLYVNGYDDWNLTELIKDPYWTSEDGHTNRDFVEQALKDSPLGMQYEVVEDSNGAPYIARK